VNILPAANLAPVTRDSAVRTAQWVATECGLDAYDPDGDAFTFQMERYPSGGTVQFKADGTAVYLPRGDFAGADSFVYTAKDCYGNVSAPTLVSVTVETNPQGIVFADMEASGNRNHYAAVKLAERNVIAYERADGKYLFNPEATVSRIDFLIMLMNVTGLDANLNAVADTPFNDARALSAGKKGYLNRGAEYGIADLGEADFRPNAPITKAEASCMIANALSLPALSAHKSFVDANDVPAWAATAVAAVTNIGFLEGERGFFIPGRPLTKSDTAAALWSIAAYMERNGFVPADHILR